MELDVIYNKSCERMSELPDKSIDLIPTDPQYGWGFMGKDWDRAVPSVEIWEECFRVLKPGALAFVMSGPRLDCLIENGMRIREAGFVISFTPIFWCFASGFPKAQNIGKVVDKRRWGSKTNEIRNYLKQVINKSGVSHKTIKEYLGYDYKSGVVSNWTVTDSGASVPSSSDWLKLKEILPIDDRYDNLILEVEREITGKGGMWGVSTHFGCGKSKWDLKPIPATPQAQALDGSYAGFQPKPAVEVVIVAMKPLSEKTYVDQALKNGHGVSWLGEGRIPYKSEEDHKIGHHNKQLNVGDEKSGCFGVNKGFGLLNADRNMGRFPANLLVSDDALNDGRVTKCIPHRCKKKRSEGGKGGVFNPSEGEAYTNISDSGSFSRYFSLDAWFDKRLKELPKGVQKTFPFLIVPKASKAEKNRGCEELKEVVKSGLPLRDGSGDYVKNEYGDGSKSTRRTKTRNYHPTVKPLKLFSYLITLGSREGDIILDPFIGSGTTAIAAKMLGRHYIGYEINKDYCDIAKARLSEVQLELCR